MIIAIDGPAASGKSTVAKAVARRLGIRYLDTGAMYRALTWLALTRGVPVDSPGALAVLARENPTEFRYPPHSALPSEVHIAGSDVTTAIRSPQVDAQVSAVAGIPEVRAVLVEQQRVLATKGDSVVEGRDIGTVVFPDADVKVFLTASAAERARRRSLDLAQAGHALEVSDVQERLERRDWADSTRSSSPLDRAADACELDTTGRTVDEIVDVIVKRFWEARR